MSVVVRRSPVSLCAALPLCAGLPTPHLVVRGSPDPAQRAQRRSRRFQAFSSSGVHAGESDRTILIPAPFHGASAAA
jgi:hypothetical protein